MFSPQPPTIQWSYLIQAKLDNGTEGELFRESGASFAQSNVKASSRGNSTFPLLGKKPIPCGTVLRTIVGSNITKMVSTLIGIHFALLTQTKSIVTTQFRALHLPRIQCETSRSSEIAHLYHSSYH